MVNSMRVLLSERNFKGHRRTYLEWLLGIEGIEFFVLAPENVQVDINHFFLYDSKSESKVGSYFEWIAQMRKIVLEHEIDTVHILDGDSIMRYFGAGFTRIGAKRLVVTYHHFFQGGPRRLSYWMMCHRRSRTCVVHTASVYQLLKKCGLTNVARCEYPSFCFESIAGRNVADCKKIYGLSEDIPTIGVIGGISGYKNIIPFLEILQQCSLPFQLLICGKVCDVSVNEISETIEPYKKSVKLVLRMLTDEEYEEAIVASDIIYCLYGHEFNGASGPLTDGVCAKKMILSCKHGSLGEITSQSLLGVTAECDDRIEVLHQTELALSRVGNFQYGEMAKRYRRLLNPAYFRETYRKIYTDR